MLNGSRVILVGSLSPLGRRVAERLVEHGAVVAGIDHVAGEPTEALAAHVVADMSAGAAADRGIDEAITALGGVDAVVLGAAVQRGGRVWETDDTTWRAVMSGTLDTAFFSLRRSLQRLGPGGSVVAISSVNAELAHPANAAYAATKGALNTLVRQAALDCAPRGIRVNAVAPALVDAPPELTPGYPMGRSATSTEVADAIAFLTSPLASGITGVVLPVDTGLSITSPVAMTRPSSFARLMEGAAAAPRDGS